MTGAFKRLPDSELLHIVLDLETLAKGELAAITEIAIEGVKDGWNRSWKIKPSSIPECFKQYPSTIEWHQKREPNYLQRLEQEGLDWAVVICSFVAFLNQVASAANKEICLWCQGTDFDIPILVSAIECYLPADSVPWKYCYVRDIRTLAALYPEIKYQKGNHSAASDVSFAAAHLRKIAFADPRVATMLGIPHS